MSEEEQVKLPESFDFTADFVKKAAQGDKLQSGVYRCLVTRVEKGVGKSEMKWFNLRLSLNPLKDPNDAQSVRKMDRISQHVIYPFVNPDGKGGANAEGAKIAEQKGKAITRMSSDILRALLGEEVIPRAPHREGAELVYKGETIDRTEYDTCMEEVITATLNQLVHLWQGENCQELIDCAPYVQVDCSGQWPNIVKMWENLPEGVELTQ